MTIEEDKLVQVIKKTRRRKAPKDSLEPIKQSTKKTGRPKELDEPEAVPMEQFIKEMHGQADKPQDGMPPLDWLKDQFSTKSAVIRYLVNQGFEVKAIAKHLGMRYQHVRNVSLQKLKRGPNEDWRKPILNPNPSQTRQNSVEFPEDTDGDGEPEPRS